MWSYLFLLIYGVFAQDLSVLNKGGFIVLQEKNGFFLVKPQESLEKSRNFLIVRVKEEAQDFEIIANASIEKKESKGLWLKIDRSQLKKLPLKGDFAILLGPPKVFENSKKNIPLPDKNWGVDEVEAQEPGYMHLGYNYYSGSLMGTSSTHADAYRKISAYTFKGIEFEWYFDFLPQAGITYRSFGGTVPVFNYYRLEIPSSYGRTNIRLNYRTSKNSMNLRWNVFLDSFYESFKTDNTDESLLSYERSSFGAGLKLLYERYPNIHNYEGKSQYLWQRTFLEVSAHPSLQNKDGTVSRGTSSVGSSRMEYGVGTTFLMDLAFIPWIHKYALQIGYMESQTTLGFAGPTTSEVNGIYTVPEGGTGTEKESYFYIQIGARFNDVVGKLFKSRN